MSRIYDAVVRSGGPIADMVLEAANGRNSPTSPPPQSPPVAVAMEGENADDSGPLLRIPPEQVEVQRLRRLVFHTDRRGPGADRFRYLRMRLREFWSAKKLRRILITSPSPREGKSTVALNLATALAEQENRKVLLIDGDLHHTAVTQDLDLGAAPGFAECLKDGLNPISAVRRLEPLGWYFLPGGHPGQDATDLLHSDALSGMIEPLVPHFDWILIDSPPVTPLADTLSLAKHADAALLVVRAEQTPREAVENAIALLGRDRVAGIVLNGMSGVDRLYSKYYGHYAS